MNIVALLEELVNGLIAAEGKLKIKYLNSTGVLDGRVYSRTVDIYSFIQLCYG